MHGGMGLDLAMPTLARLGLALIEPDARCCTLGKAFFTHGPILFGPDTSPHYGKLPFFGGI